jgi:hypothetical protein
MEIVEKARTARHKHFMAGEGAEAERFWLA